jgi:protein-tyrosine phosphatase
MESMPGDPYRVTFVCSGNICRSAMGHIILSRLVEEAGLADRVSITSSGTGDWHVGEHADPRTVAVLERYGYDGSAHRAREFDPSELDEVDLVLASDWGHVHTLARLARTEEQRRKIRLVREFDPDAVASGLLETADPWYGDTDHFERCFREVEAACHGILAHLQSELD